MYALALAVALVLVIGFTYAIQYFGVFFGVIVRRCHNLCYLSGMKPEFVVAIIFGVAIVYVVMKITELEARLDAETERANKIAAEVKTLKDSLSNTDLPQAAVDSLDRLSAALKGVDDLNEDAPPVA